MVQVLEGIRVIDMTHMIAGPYATTLLAHFGADVIKVESEQRPDGFRFREGRHHLMSRSFSDFNRGKRGICLNFTDPDEREQLLELIDSSDVLIENFSARVLEKWELTFPHLAPRNPRLVMVSMQGLGRTGPQRDYVTWGPSLLSLTGINYLWNHPDMEQPVGSQTAHPDYISGVNGALAAMAGLMQRERTGQGVWFDLAQVEATGALLGPIYLASLLKGLRARPRGNQRPDRAPWNCYPCRGDDAWCMITVDTEEQWQAMVSVVGSEAGWDGVDVERFSSVEKRLEQREELDERIASWTSKRTPEEVMQQLQAVGVPAGLVAKGEQLYEDPQLQHRGFIAHVKNPKFRDISFPGLPFRLERTPGRADHRPPLLGEHTEEVLEELRKARGTETEGGGVA